MYIHIYVYVHYMYICIYIYIYISTHIYTIPGSGKGDFSENEIFDGGAPVWVCV